MKKATALKYALGGMTASVILMTPGMAGADTKSYRGDNFSVDTNHRRKMITCDQESDNNKVHADIKFTGSSSTHGKFVVDGDGNNGVCAERTILPTDPRISHHRTVEQRLLGDIKGNWVSTT